MFPLITQLLTKEIENVIQQYSFVIDQSGWSIQIQSLHIIYSYKKHKPLLDMQMEEMNQFPSRSCNRTLHHATFSLFYSLITIRHTAVVYFRFIIRRVRILSKVRSCKIKIIKHYRNYGQSFKITQDLKAALLLRQHEKLPRRK